MPISGLEELLVTMEPRLNPSVVVYCALPAAVDPMSLPVVGWFREEEGVTVIVEEAAAAAHGLVPLFRAAWLTLTVQSDLQAIGFTAAVAKALADAQISCNVVAAIHHDHLFVPAEAGSAALAVLRRLQAGS